VKFTPHGRSTYGTNPAWGEVSYAGVYGNEAELEAAPVVAPEEQLSVPQLIEAVVFSFQTVGQDEGLRVAAENSRGQSPALVLAATEYIRTRSLSPEDLEARIAELRTEESRALQSGNANAAQIASYKIQMLRRRHTGIVDEGELQGVRDLTEISGQANKWKERLPLIGIGVGLVGLMITLGVVKVRKREKKG